jgi:septum formation protein
MHLVLASASPRRAELLRAAGIDFETLTVDVDESPRPGEPARDYVRRLAKEKSTRAQVVSGFPSKLGAGSRTVEELIFLGADTAVVIDGDILGKPGDDQEAAAMLRRLSGRQHEVMTGISLRLGTLEVGSVEVTQVEFVSLGDADIAWYVKSGEGRDKAGGYAIQGLAARFIPRIDGSYSNVVGLPIAAVHVVLAQIASGVHPGYSQ